MSWFDTAAGSPYCQIRSSSAGYGVQNTRLSSEQENAPYGESNKQEMSLQAPLQRRARCTTTNCTTNTKPKRVRNDWAKHKDEIERIFVTENQTLAAVKGYMESSHGFPHMKDRAYEKAFQRLGIRKKIPQVVMESIIGTVQRRQDERKRTQVLWCGTIVDAKKIDRAQRDAVRRSTNSAVSSPRVSASIFKHLEFRTPESSRSSSPIPPSHCSSPGGSSNVSEAITTISRETLESLSKACSISNFISAYLNVLPNKVQYSVPDAQLFEQAASWIRTRDAKAAIAALGNLRCRFIGNHERMAYSTIGLLIAYSIDSPAPDWKISMLACRLLTAHELHTNFNNKIQCVQLIALCRVAAKTWAGIEKDLWPIFSSSIYEMFNQIEPFTIGLDEIDMVCNALKDFAYTLPKYFIWFAEKCDDSLAAREKPPIRCVFAISITELFMEYRLDAEVEIWAFRAVELSQKDKYWFSADVDVGQTTNRLNKLLRVLKIFEKKTKPLSRRFWELVEC